ncbi:MAG: glutamate--tRNA ligase, partial [Clostridia bacterium]|nr:glutamate--tRNA ligase [Clostridia bacterium]
GFKAPKYAHISPIMVEEEGHKRKLSKRKDPQAAMHFYAEQGYPADSVLEYLMTIASSEFEQWRKANPQTPRRQFPFNIKKMSVSGALFDIQKMNDVSKNVIASMNTETVLQAILSWAKEFNKPFYALLEADLEYARNIFAIDRDNPKPRKDMAKWSDAPAYSAYFFDSTFDSAFTLPENIQPADAKAIIEAYAKDYEPISDQAEWFAKVKAMCPDLGYCPDVKEYKKNPDGYKGHVGDLSTVLRLAVTGRRNTPDLCRIMEMLGKERVLNRLHNAANAL